MSDRIDNFIHQVSRSHGAPAATFNGQPVATEDVELVQRLLWAECDRRLGIVQSTDTGNTSTHEY